MNKLKLAVIGVGASIACMFIALIGALILIFILKHVDANLTEYQTNKAANERYTYYLHNPDCNLIDYEPWFNNAEFSCDGVTIKLWLPSP